MSINRVYPVLSGESDAAIDETEVPRLAGAGEWQLALETSQRQLTTLTRENQQLRHAHFLLMENVALLERALAKAKEFAYHDELTGLPNRRLLLDRFRQATSLADRHCQAVALLFFDLDKFKSINDRLGHEAGDELLKQTAERLTRAIRKSDTACRYGGDEFVVLLAQINNREDAIKGLAKIRKALAPPYELSQHAVRVSVSDGIALYPRDSRGFSDLVRLSDRSMLANKKSSNGQSDVEGNGT